MQLMKLQGPAANNEAPGYFEWHMKEFTTGNEAFLMDPLTFQLFSYPSKGAIPRLVGHVDSSNQVNFVKKEWLTTLIQKTDLILSSQEQVLQDIFKNVADENLFVITRECAIHVASEVFNESDTKW